MTEVCFTLHGQPLSWNHMYHIERRGHRNMPVKTEELAIYQDYVERTCAKSLPAGWKPESEYEPKLGTGLIVVEYHFFLKRDIDCDNVMKATNDAIALGLGWKTSVTRKGRAVRRPIYDDVRFLPRAMTKIAGVKDPRIEVTLRG